MKNVYATLILAFSFASPLVAQENTGGFRETFSAWASSMNRGFRSVFTQPATPAVSIPSTTTTTTTTPSPVNVAPPAISTPNSSSLTADVLKKTLVAKTPDESAYIDAIVAKRDAGKISAQVVNGAYRYAMKKSTDRRAQYFKAAIDAMTGGR